MNRVFTHEDQEFFAKLSGDYNPIHIDKIRARRLLYGSTVVHGVHLILWALNCWFKKKKNNIELISIKTNFIKQLNVGELVKLRFLDKENGYETLELWSDNILITKIKFNWQISISKKSHFLKNTVPRKVKPRLVNIKNINHRSGSLALYFDKHLICKNFPALNNFAFSIQIALILSSTRLVGMHCPGLNSLFYELYLSFNTPIKIKKLEYRVEKFDKRFNYVTINLRGSNSTGHIKCFIRPEKIVFKKHNLTHSKLAKNEFADQSAIVIGGSRGLGEVTVKLLAAGSANVKFSYFKGERDAKKILNDIHNYNGGKASIFQYDVLTPNDRMLKKILQDYNPTHLYYFATPFIFSATKGNFSKKIYSQFYDYYVNGFKNIMEIVLTFGIKNVYYPSSIALNECPPDMQEYVSAKTDGEALCEKFMENNKMINIYKPRLPRLETDQTVSLSNVFNHDPFKIQLKHLRNLKAKNEI